jgi:hypothetical protein
VTEGRISRACCPKPQLETVTELKVLPGRF